MSPQSAVCQLKSPHWHQQETFFEGVTFDSQLLHLLVGHLEDVMEGHTFLQEEGEKLLKTVSLKELLQLDPFLVGESLPWL